MPSRNTERIDIDDSYYHVYARGASKQPIYLEDSDYIFFISLFRRYLSSKPVIRKSGPPYPNFYGDISLIAYCLMQNHFHMFVYQKNAGALSALMRGVMTSYSRYFNFKYRKTGSLFENRYKSSLVKDERYYIHITRYIHLNPRYWKRYPYSSVRYYLHRNSPEWLVIEDVLDQFEGPKNYIEFLEDYIDSKSQLDEIKHHLADQ